MKYFARHGVYIYETRVQLIPCHIWVNCISPEIRIFGHKKTLLLLPIDKLVKSGFLFKQLLYLTIGRSNKSVYIWAQLFKASLA